MSTSTDLIAKLNPAECALLVMDFQPVVLDSMADGAALIESANAAIATARRRGMRVVFVRVALSREDAIRVPPTNRSFFAAAKGGYLDENLPTTALYGNLDARDEDLVVRKVRVGAFSSLPLDESLTNEGITTLVLAGVHTSGVILSTVREAADRDYRLIVLTDCVSDPDRDLHETLLTQIIARQADLVTNNQFEDLIARS